jgi:hypothetical protein
MDNVLYSKTVLPARESHDGETPLRVLVTEEVNAIIIWLDGTDTDPSMTPLAVFSNYQKNKAIEVGVSLANLDGPDLFERALAIRRLIF